MKNHDLFSDISESAASIRLAAEFLHKHEKSELGPLADLLARVATMLEGAAERILAEKAKLTMHPRRGSRH